MLLYSQLDSISSRALFATDRICVDGAKKIRKPKEKGNDSATKEKKHGNSATNQREDGGTQSMMKKQKRERERESRRNRSKMKNGRGEIT